jgi:hypothetical protein|tara:strand:+ start:320 stop:724 length:405 start_codon:yes stop_codon:yes gene_type:complete
MGLKDEIFEALVGNIQPDNPGENFSFSDAAVDKVDVLAQGLTDAIITFIEAQTFMITEAEATIQIPPISSTVLNPVPVAGALGVGVTTAPIVAVSPVILSKAVLLKDGAPSNQSPEAAAKAQSSKVKLINTVKK